MVGLTKYRLRDIFSKFHSGDSIKANEIHDIDRYPVFGGNGIRGYCNRYNHDGEYIIIGRQGAYCGNVRYYCGKAFLTEHAIVGKPKKEFSAVYLANKLSIINLSRFQGQSAQPGLSVETLSNVEIELPSYFTQIAIGEILSMIDKQIETLTAINRNLEQVARQLYDYWFVQFDFPNHEGKPYKTSGGEMGWNEALKRYIPKGWSNATLSEIANITMGQSPDSSSYNDIGEGSIFYQGSTDFGIRFPKVRQYTTAPNRYARKGDILMSVRAPVGTLNIANNDCCIGRGLAALNSKIGSITHLYCVMCDLKAVFDQQNSAGTTFGSITKDTLYGLAILLPTIDLVKSFDNICQPIFDEQMRIGEQIVDLQRLRDELLPMLLNGQVNCDLLQ